MKPRASTSRGPVAKVYNISYTCYHNSFVIFLVLHVRIIRPLALISALILSFHKSSEIDKGGDSLGRASQVE